MDKIGKLVVILGLGVVAVGLLLWQLGDKLRFLGRLPGDFRYESGSTRVYIPFTTMLLVSILLSIIGWLWRRFGGGA
jgi:hypothetical protein